MLAELGFSEPKQPEVEPSGPSARPCCLMRKTKNIYRKAFSETQLLEILPFDLQDGFSYHCLTAGNVDSLSYLKHIIRLQDLDYCLFSTWCMENDDILQIEEWLQSGKIKRLDAYVGEIFPSTYSAHYRLLCGMIDTYGRGGRVCVFKNHSKIFSGTGKKFSFSVESSANINTNPRTENGCVTIGEEIFNFHKSYFDEIRSIKEHNKGWKPWEA